MQAPPSPNKSPQPTPPPPPPPLLTADLLHLDRHPGLLELALHHHGPGLRLDRQLHGQHQPAAAARAAAVQGALCGDALLRGRGLVLARRLLVGAAGCRGAGVLAPRGDGVGAGGSDGVGVGGGCAWGGMRRLMLAAAPTTWLWLHAWLYACIRVYVLAGQPPEGGGFSAHCLRRLGVGCMGRAADRCVGAKTTWPRALRGRGTHRP